MFLEQMLCYYSVVTHETITHRSNINETRSLAGAYGTDYTMSTYAQNSHLYAGYHLVWEKMNSPLQAIHC